MDTTIVLPPVVVTATRIATPLMTAPARVMYVDDHAVQAVAARSVVDVLEARSGAFLRRYGPGGLGSITLRGTGAAQTLVLLDGQRMSDPQLGQMDLTLLPVLLLEGMEVMHGAGAALYGSDAIGGVVNLHTRTPTEQVSGRIVGGYGDYGERQAGAVFSGRARRLSGIVALDYWTTNGDHPFFDASLFPPREVRRDGADSQRQAAYARVGYTTRRHTFTLSGWQHTAERGLPRPVPGVSRDERQWDNHTRLWASDHIAMRWGSVQVRGLWQAASLRYTNPFLQIDDTGKTRVGTLEAEARVVVHPQWVVGGGLMGGWTRAIHPSLSDQAAMWHSAAFMHASGEKGRLLIYPAMRIDQYDFSDGPHRLSLSPRLGANFQPLPRPFLRLKAHIGRTFRVPTFNDRFWQPGGNPDLKPENGWSYDTGLILQQKATRHLLQAEVTVFQHHIQDQIVWQPTPAGYWSPANIGKVQTRGLEGSGTVQWRPAMNSLLETGIVYTYTDAQDRSDPSTSTYGMPLRYTPKQQLKVHAGMRWRFIHMNLSGRYVGQRFVTADGTQFLDPYHVLDAQVLLYLTWQATQLTLSAALENSTDTAYEGIKGYPMPPRLLRIKAVLALGD